MRKPPLWYRALVFFGICGIYFAAWLWSRRTDPPKPSQQQFCKDEEETGFYLPCEWVKHESEA